MRNAQEKLSNQLAAEKVEKKQYSEINGKYFLKSYSFGLIISVFAFLIFDWANEKDYTALLIISFLLYPFARIFYDALIGFKFDFKMKKQSFATFYFIQLQFFIHLLLYLSSIYLAPFGVFYLIFRLIYRFVRKRLT